MTILLGLLVGAAIGAGLGRVLPIVPLKPKYAPGDKVWISSPRRWEAQAGEVVDVSNGAYFVTRPTGYGQRETIRVSFKEGVKTLSLRDEEAA